MTDAWGRLHVEVLEDEIIIILPFTNYTVYYKPANSPGLLAKNFPTKDDSRVPTIVVRLTCSTQNGMDLCDFLARKIFLPHFLDCALPSAVSCACLDGSDEIPFAQFNTAVPQDVVGRGAVEIKVGQHEMHQIWLAFETHLVFTKG
jgi:hypothetical protein